MNSNTFYNPSIGTDHLRGWWTVMWKQVCREKGILNAEAITLEELLLFVRQLYSEHLSAKQNVKKGKLLPLLVDEIVRCPKNVELTVDDNLHYWYELSRGFMLDPQSWNPSLFSHEPVQLKCSMNDTGHEYEIDHVKQVDEAFIKPEILEQSIQQQHKLLTH
ncbi:hypothetical protein PsorP6_001433 [Peronosclerospora sorghi]|uniref:Uncharacterized protein n=1 Tax=Peronosclerospora sorghi TaxID=230839 RepID=A0ACC0WUG2_9STRA|nr:hypothetical protein PsorP6_001433 [Peronosclerospora sorghi]